MRLLIVTQYFPPEIGASQTRLFELSTHLAKMGVEVTVLTGMPNYPTGRIFDGYRWKVRMTEQMDSVKVIRVCFYPSKSKKFLPRLISYGSFALSSLVFGVWGLEKCDIILIDSPPPFIVPSGLVISKITGAKPVLIVADIWPYGVIRAGYASEKSLLIKPMLWLEKFSYNHSYAVALTSPRACALIRARFPHLKNITLISNGVDTKMFFPELRKQEIRSQLGAGPDDFLVGYCGLHGISQGLEVVLDTAHNLRERSDIKFVMIGDGPTKEELLQKANKLKLTNLTFYDHRPKNQMPGILASLDVSLIPLAMRYPEAMPSKIYEALASGAVPVVVKGCEAEPLVNQYNAGRCYEPGDADEMAAAILQLADDRSLLERIRKNCVRLAKRFDRDLIAHRTKGILVAVMEGRQLPEVEW
jgi:glycosyltransferase involved in cell wall biosynthesis